ncbi:MAG: PDZ domain-containing protein [Candidatus Marinimicrobia bacterium]|nr:PDZ domain-containing protein [Candidatus Neomarinimicrobiota bacterium]MCF7840086.1 PDZ domain-containing protein [Candidatus Neomarinimicrobiota bacterium]MCF7902357.1 PDZ domain-containing protein [Candidatus Neomarinimicrobiota bacterium]
MKRLTNTSILFAITFFAGIPWQAKGQIADSGNKTEEIIQVAAANVEAAAARVEQQRLMVEKKQAELEAESARLGKGADSMAVDSELHAKPRLGVYLSNLDFEDAYKRRYPYNYGVYVSGVVEGGGADLAGIIEGDIIMTFDGENAQFEDHLVRLIQSKKVGDTVPVAVFRDEKELTLNVTLSSSGKTGGKFEGEFVFKSGDNKKSVGYGGGGWTPVWFVQDMSDVNTMLTALNLDEIGADGVLMQGGGGHGNVGNGWFIGGQGMGYTIDRKVGMTIGPDQVTRHLKFDMGMGGVMLDKRFALTKKLVPSIGFMLGGGAYNLEVSQTNGEYDWSTMAADLASSSNNAVKLQRDFIVLQPRIGLLIRVLPWMSIRAEGGYAYGYSWHKGWKAMVGNDSYVIKNSPDTPFQGATASVGLWFGY